MTTQPKAKWRFAIGTTSIVPTEPGKHYLVADVDGADVGETLLYLINWRGIHTFHLQRTRHGWHIYTNQRLPWRKLLSVLTITPGVDQQWVAIGRQRGYLFLADKAKVTLHWPVKRMVLHYGKVPR